MVKKKAEQPAEKYLSSTPQTTQQSAAVVAPVAAAMKQVPKAVATSVNRLFAGGLPLMVPGVRLNQTAFHGHEWIS